MSLINTVLTIFISIVAAGASLLTFAYTFTLKARVEIQIGEQVILHYTERMHLIVTADFVILNKGAQQAAITALLGTIWPRDSPQPSSLNLIWQKYEQTKRDAPRTPYYTESSGMVESTVVPGRSASVARIRLYSTKPLRLDGVEENYIVKFEAVDGALPPNPASLICHLHLKKEDAETLLTDGVEKAGNFQERISLKRVRVISDDDHGSAISRRLGRLAKWRSRQIFAEFESEGRWHIL
jgi:hypothetical protein